MPREMKETGIEWIGKVPKDWDIVPSKYLFKSTKTIVGALEKQFERLALTMNGVIKRSKTNSDGLQPADFSGYQILDIDQLVFKLIDLQNISTSRVGISPYKGIVSPAYIILKKNNDDTQSKFYYYWYMSMYYNRVFNLLGDSGVRSNINSTELLDLKVPMPPLEEQKKIADLLDKKCQEIEDIKETIDSEIKTLDEYKKSIITEAVTKGLDKGAEMKDSGIEWIGQIPKHWKRGKIKQICKIIGSGTTPLSSNFNYYSDGKYNWIQSGDLYKQDKIVKTEKMITQEALDRYLSLKVYKSPFLVMAMYGASVGNLSLSLIDAATNQACCVMKNNKDNDLIYMYYWLTFVKNDLLMKAEGGSQPNISQDKIKNQFIFTPPINEQKAIAEYLDHKTSAINEDIDGKRAQLVALDEYKKSLIYEYVTGKKEA